MQKAMISNQQNIPTKAHEEWQKSIPAQVFLNHFRSIDYYIRHTTPFEEVQQLVSLQRFNPKREGARVGAAKKWLLHAWSAEYTLRTAANHADENYQKHSLHWTFPQAYYSVLYSAKSFLAIQGIDVPIESVIGQIINGYVAKGWYPESIGFYVDGPMEHYTYHHLPAATEQALLQSIDTPKQAEAHIAQFLKTTRDLRMRALRRRLQSNPEKALRSKTGKILSKFSTSHWEEISKHLGPTTYFDLMSRLKVSGTQREIERFVEADIDVPKFHQSLLNIVKYLNFIHECYVAKVMGLKAYQQWIEELPSYLRQSFLQQRYENGIIPIVSAVTKF